MSKERRAACEAEFAVVDLFAGPGGLAEGFWAVRHGHGGQRPFRIALSVEKDRAAHSTLLLRTFLREFPHGFPKEYYKFLREGTPEPDWAARYPREWNRASSRAMLKELGQPAAEAAVGEKLWEVRAEYGDKTVLIGGPPCQAYSLIGRARNRGREDYAAEKDPRQTLYREYVKVLTELRPAAFVMENVRGILSASLHAERIFERIQADLLEAGGGYRLVPLDAPADSAGPLLDAPVAPTKFVVRSEKFGVPQARHRVIVVGVRRDLAERLRPWPAGALLRPKPAANVRDALGGMPVLRSGLSTGDSPENWRKALERARELVRSAAASLPRADREGLNAVILRCEEFLRPALRGNLRRRASTPECVGRGCPKELAAWLIDRKLDVLANNETRAHIEGDLARYLFAAAYGEVKGASPKAADFPEALWPLHENWMSGKFADRFRVQLWERPSSTVTSHISKDGHYFIHPDPRQCRSLTVREAARLQTFPDNYLFKGNRTEQFVQIGNAVPPLLAKQVAQALYPLLARAVDAAGRAASARG